MAETKLWAIGLVIICTLFTSIGAVFLKRGIDRFAFNLEGVISAYPVIIGLFFYFLGFILLTLSFRYGELSVLFPFVSLSFVWVASMSFFFLGESINLVELLGLAAIVSGVVIIGASSRNKRKLKLKG